MKITFDRAERDYVAVEGDGTLVCAFMRTGHIRTVSRLRFNAGESATLDAITVTSAKEMTAGAEDGGGKAAHALVFVTESEAGEKLRIMERFASIDDATTAHAMVRRALAARARLEWAKRVVKGVAVYVLLPLLVLALLGPALGALSAKGQSADLTAAILAEANRTTATPALAAPLVPVSPGARTAEPAGFSMEGAVKISADSVTVPDSRTLYVFSDPKCPSCREFEAEVEELAKDHAVYVFPLAYKKGSDEVAIDVLCKASNEDKLAAWRDAMTPPIQGAEGSLNEVLFAQKNKAPALCDFGKKALKGNMSAFESLHFTKTPTVMTADGRYLSGPTTAAEIREFASK